MAAKTATVFNIQKFSLHDVPGIRTSVFFKGCNQTGTHYPSEGLISIVCPTTKKAERKV